MRVNIGVLLIGLVSGGSVFAQDLCGNIRLSVSEQIECRGRLTNAMGEGDRTRIQQEFEDRIRRANDQLITPPVLRGSPPPLGTSLPNTAPLTPLRPPTAPDTPALPGSTTNSVSGSTLPGPPGNVAPRAAPPAGTTAIAPDMTAPEPAASPLPPISPIPPNPSGALTPLK